MEDLYTILGSLSISSLPNGGGLGGTRRRRYSANRLSPTVKSPTSIPFSTADQFRLDVSLRGREVHWLWNHPYKLESDDSESSDHRPFDRYVAIPSSTIHHHKHDSRPSRYNTHVIPEHKCSLWSSADSNLFRPLPPTSGSSRRVLKPDQSCLLLEDEFPVESSAHLPANIINGLESRDFLNNPCPCSSAACSHKHSPPPQPLSSQHDVGSSLSSTNGTISFIHAAVPSSIDRNSIVPNSRQKAMTGGGSTQLQNFISTSSGDFGGKVGSVHGCANESPLEIQLLRNQPLEIVPTMRLPPSFNTLSPHFPFSQNTAPSVFARDQFDRQASVGMANHKLPNLLDWIDESDLTAPLVKLNQCSPLRLSSFNHIHTAAAQQLPLDTSFSKSSVASAAAKTNSDGAVHCQQPPSHSNHHQHNNCALEELTTQLERTAMRPAMSSMALTMYS